MLVAAFRAAASGYGPRFMPLGDTHSTVDQSTRVAVRQRETAERKETRGDDETEAGTAGIDALLSWSIDVDVDVEVDVFVSLFTPELSWC